MYDEAAATSKWLAKWKEDKLFEFNRNDAKKRLFVIDTPPPFTNGELHMGQVFWVSYIDSIARYMRMKGYNVLYPQGWDVHGFATEIAVEKKFGRSLPREEFYRRAIEVSNANIALMKAQMLSLGASFDEKLEYSTLAKDYMAKVQLALILMHEKNMLYRADHPVPWCINCGTAISREQSQDVEKKTSLNYVNFAIKDGNGAITIATTRPELMHACVAVAVNPSDTRYSQYIGKKATVPVFGGEVEIIVDDSVDKDFGTGAEMICTFGDKEDTKMFYKHGLKLIEAMDTNGKLKNAGKFTGADVRKVRQQIVAELESQGALKKREETTHTVKVHDRCGTEAELLSYTQWFIKVKESAKRIKELSSEIRWVPAFTRQRLADWADGIEWDWNISRKRVFGTPIPFWYCEICGAVVAPDKKSLPVNPAVDQPPAGKCPNCDGKLVGESDTCDGWVDTCITPLVICGWPDKSPVLERGFPTALRIQGTDIVRTWAFYTILGTWAVSGSKPWESIIAHGMILGEDGREMHKSWGNGVNPAELMQKYSADAIRLWVAIGGGIGKDRPFSYKELDHAKGFINKLYNTAVFVSGRLKEIKLPDKEPHEHLGIFDVWILNRLNHVVKDVEQAYDGFMLYEAMNSAIDFYWHEFADYYIENVKHRVYSTKDDAEGSRAAAAYTLNHVLLASLRLFAPVMPFVAEEINSMFGNTKSIFNDQLPHHADVPEPAGYAINGLVFRSSIVEKDIEGVGTMLNKVIAEVRKEKARNRIALNKEIASININVPDEYNSALTAAEGELKQICKAREVKVSSSENFSVSITLQPDSATV